MSKRLLLDPDIQAELDHVGRRAFVAALVVLGIFVLIIGSCFLLRLSPERVVVVSTILFQGGALSYTFFFLMPFFLKSMLLSHQSIRLGSTANEKLATLQNELKPVITELRDAVKDGREILREFKDEDLDKLHEVADRLTKELDGQGKFHRATAALEKIADLTDRDRWRKLLDESDSDLTRTVARRIDAMLGDDEPEEGKPDGA